MKSHIFYLATFLFISLILGCALVLCQNQKQLPTENFYDKSLHYTNNGITHVYSKTNGGLERLTGMSATDVGCVKANCHASSCDVCHKKENDGNVSYTLDSNVVYEACKQCHGDMAKDNPDVHFNKGMKCMQCHTTREIHGDGTEQYTYMKPGFFDVNCEKCHSSRNKSLSHTVHKGKLDCTPCHVREITTCYNCHIDTRLKKGKESSIQLKNMYFLVNHDNKVKLANFLTYVFHDTAMMTFAPTFPHSIKKEGKKCIECHDTKIVQEIKSGKFNPVRWEKEKLTNIEGVVPVFGVTSWDLTFLTKESDKWIPLKNPPKPLLNYSGYCSPLTDEQFSKLVKIQKGK